MNRKKEAYSLLLGVLGVFISLLGLIMFNQYVLMTLPLGLRMISMILTHWAIMIVPIILIIAGKEELSAYGIKTDRIGTQISTGVRIGVLMSLVLTVIPIFLGFGGMVGDRKNNYLWQFVFDFVYFIIGVSFEEEFIFRGFIYEKIKRITGKTSLAVIVSSILFGLAHIFGGNVLQVIVTAGIGVIFCCCRLKIKSCTLLSLVFAHGIYDALITVWISVLT